MRTALTIWDGRISPVFDVCREALILDVAGGRVVSATQESLESPTPFGKVERLAALGVDTLVCGAVSEPLRRALLACGIRVHGFMAGEIHEVVRVIASGALPDPSFAMPGCRGRQMRRRGGRGQGRGFGGRGRGGRDERS
ncbi:MAG: NifB/NifX family molybdenum-iron cluster-binding protein [Planctomycetes bacterium]|jgi:predicted Fe-Mo cluster-binding NifX family protein|nr:NifB/NifX family molybdenum-iron cluster-binding protein [Planctomycetota bacterium]